MEKYNVNGVEFEYDTFDLENVGLWEDENRRVQAAVEEMGRRARQGGDAVTCLRESCNVILDFFDAVVGEGTAKSLFGGRVNVRDIFAGYKEFARQVAGNMQGVSREMADGQPNREARRAAGRAAR